jgi:hypothetical protein
VVLDLALKQLLLRLAGQLAVQQQEGGVDEVALSRQLLNGVAAWLGWRQESFHCSKAAWAGLFDLE